MWHKARKANQDDQLILSDNYYDLALYSFYVTESHLNEQVEFEKSIIRNNLKMEQEERKGNTIHNDHHLKKAYDH